MKVYNSTLVYIEKAGKYLMLHRNKKAGDINEGKWIGVGGKKDTIMKVYNSTLVYIEKDGKYLMLHRNKKANDINEGKWIGVGGKFEFGESPEDCMEREVFEETGLTPMGYYYCGIVTFVSEDLDKPENNETEYMHLFNVKDFEGELKSCDEGELVWVDKDKLLSLPHWKGDELFLSIIKNGNRQFFSMKLSYVNGRLIEAVYDTVPCFITERLILRPWHMEDVEDLFKYAKDPDIGLSAGWKPHKDVGESMEVIENVFMKPGVYAIVYKETNEVIGSIGLHAGSKKSRGLGSDENQAEIGYWIAKPYWGRGLIPEAAKELVDFGFLELGLNRIWIAYFDGNHKSKRVAEKLGFTYSHFAENVVVEALGETKKEHYMVLNKDEFDEAIKLKYRPLLAQRS